MSKKKILVFYHAHCFDGLLSAWVASLKLKKKADYFPVNYSDYQILKKIKGKTIYLLDLSLPKRIILALKKNQNYLILIDHHLSSEKFLDLFDEKIFNKNHSGCVLTFSYFFKKKKPFKILKHIEDFDLWRFSFKNSLEIFAYLESLEPLDFKKINQLVKKIENEKTRKRIIQEGKVIQRYKESLLKKLEEKAFLVNFENYQVLAVNTSVLISEIGNYLTKKKPPFSIIFYHNQKGTRVSLRGDGSIDLSKIAEKYGGGGHFSAASFFLPLGKKKPWERANNYEKK